MWVCCEKTVRLLRVADDERKKVLLGEEDKRLIYSSV